MPGARIGDWGGFGQVGQQLVLVPRARGHCRRSQNVPSSILHKEGLTTCSALQGSAKG